MRYTQEELDLIHEENLHRSKTKSLAEINEMKAKEEYMNIYNELAELKANGENKVKKYTNFVNETKRGLLSEALCVLFEKCCGIEGGDKANTIRRNLVDNFIRENGTETLLNKMGKESMFLAEMSNTIRKTYNRIMEGCDKDDESTFQVNVEDRDMFYDELNMDDMEDMSSNIKMRTAAEMDEFMAANRKEKVEIKEIIDDVQEKIKDETNEEIKEHYEGMAKAKINDLRNKPEKTIIEAMVHNMIKSVLINEDAKKVYFKDNRINMDKIVEECNLVYTFMEMLNTTKLAKIDEAYILKTIESFKK